MSSAEADTGGAGAGANTTDSPHAPRSPPRASSPAGAGAATAAPSSSSAPSSTTSTGLSNGPSAAAPGPGPPGSNMHPPGSFSSSPVAPVVANNHHRRWRRELGWMKPGGDLRRRDDGAASPGGTAPTPAQLQARGRPAAVRRSRSPSHDSAKSDTSDEDIRAPRAVSEAATAGTNSTGRPHDSPSLLSTPGSHSHGAGQLMSHTAGHDSRGLSHPPARRSRSQSPEDEATERRAYLDATRDAPYANRSRTPSPVERDVQIMFKGREIFADDLIGLRVAKTFAGHGRFLGQVVKFDGPTSLYTVVYADGDAEDLSVESTIQILIQDEIERVDPALPAPSSSQFFRREGSLSTGVGSPTDADSAEAAAAIAAAAGGAFRSQRSQSSASSEYRPSAIRISDREAQFVVGLFENHALPILLQQGWRVQSNLSGGEARYVAPGVGDGFSSSGAVFRSALDVVAYIASDSELLTACFPTNVHSAILSLLPDSSRQQALEQGAGVSSTGVRKRATADVSEFDGFAGKRYRQPRDGAYGGAGAGIKRRGAPPAGVSPHAEAAATGHAYRSAELEYRMREREAAARQGLSADRFASAEPSRVGAAGLSARQPYYSATDYRGAHSRHLSDASASSSRWSGEPADASAPSKPLHHHRRYDESPRWRERDEPVRGGYYASEPSSVDAAPRGYPRAERYYGGGYGSERTLTRPGFRSARAELPPEYRYQAQEEAPLGAAADAYRHRYADAPPHRGGYADGRYLDAAMEHGAGRLARDAAGLGVSDARMRRESPAISMLDVDRLAGSRAAARGEQAGGRSPRAGVDASAAYGAFRGQYVGQRAPSGLYATDANGAAGMDVSNDAPAAQDEERAV